MIDEGEEIMKVLVIIPAYNEAENIESVVEILKNQYPQYDYVVVNDGSKDQTAQICRENGYNLLDLPINVGLSGGFQAGMKYAKLNGYDAAIQFDGDGQHDPRYIQNLLEAMEKEGADIVIGSRFVEQKKPWTSRMIGSRIIHFAIWLTTGKKIADPTSGMRLFSKKVLSEFASSMNYGPEPDTICYLLRNGAKITEVQVEMHERTAGESYLNIPKSFWYMLCMTISIFFVQWFRKRRV